MRFVCYRISYRKESTLPRPEQQLKELILVMLNDVRQNTEKAEMFCWFIKNSNQGESCGYAQKALEFFYDKHWKDVREALLGVVSLMQEMESLPHAPNKNP